MEKKIKAFAEGDSNFMSTNGALVTHAIWKEAIRADPFKQSRQEGDNERRDREQRIHQMVSREVKNIYETAKSQATEGELSTIGSCRKCGLMGHLTTECMNILRNKEGKEVAVVEGIGKGKSMLP